MFDLLTTWAVSQSCTYSFTFLMRPIAVGDVLIILDPSQLSGNITWFQYVRLFDVGRPNIQPERSRHVYLEANRIMFNINQPKAKTTIMPVCLPGYVATCLLYSFDRSFAYVNHTCLTQSQLIGARSQLPLTVDYSGRWSPWLSITFVITITSDRRSLWSSITLIKRSHFRSR